MTSLGVELREITCTKYIKILDSMSQFIVVFFDFCIKENILYLLLDK